MQAYLAAHWHAVVIVLAVWAVLATALNKVYPRPVEPKWAMILHMLFIDWPAAIPSVDMKGIFGSQVNVPYLTLSRKARVPPKLPPPIEKVGMWLPFILTTAAFFAALAMAGCCKGEACKQTVSKLTACAVNPIPTEVQNLVPAVNAVLSGGAPNWEAQLTALEQLGVGAVVCAVQAVIEGVMGQLTPPRYANIEPTVIAKAERGQLYLNHKGYKLQKPPSTK